MFSGAKTIAFRENRKDTGILLLYPVRIIAQPGEENPVTSEIVICSKRVLLRNELRAAIIHVNGNRIQSVTETESAQCSSQALAMSRLLGVNCYDAGDKLITPAFINCHTHLAMNFFRALSPEQNSQENLIGDFFYLAESKLDAKDIESFTRVAAFESLLSGVGLVWDHYYEGESVAQGCADAGLCAVVAPTLQDLNGPGKQSFEKHLDQTTQLCHERWANQGIFAAVGPHATDTVSNSLWEKALTLASQYRLPIHLHVAQRMEEMEYISRMYSCSPFEHLDRVGLFSSNAPTLLVHGVYATEKDLSYLKSPKDVLVVCPYSQMVFQFPARVLDWEKKKVAWAIGTDCAASNDSMNVQKELRLISGLPSLAASFLDSGKAYFNNGKIEDAQAQWSIRNSLFQEHQIFSDPAFLLQRILDIPGRQHPAFTAGVVEAGSLANLVIWDTDHPNFWPSNRALQGLVKNDVTGAIYNLMVFGKWKGEDGNFSNSLRHGKAYQEALIEAQKRLQYFAQKIRLPL
jgi:5-methylthioadenosine/S-adenosylhomocysteine deaminase